MTHPPSPPQRWIAHMDLDAFFASCEQQAHPEFSGRPVVVGALPGHRGVVAAASYEARRFGIRSAMPIAEAHRRCPDAVFVRPEMDRYRRMSGRVFEILTTISPCMEAASIDEAYLDVSGLEKLFGTPEVIARTIKQRIFEQTGLTASPLLFISATIEATSLRIPLSAASCVAASQFLMLACLVARHDRPLARQADKDRRILHGKVFLR